MDYDVLNRMSETMLRSVLSQDTTELWELLHPMCQLAHKEADTGSAPPAIVATGSIEVGRATRKVFEWMQRAKAIVQPRATCDVRRRQQAPAIPALNVSGTSSAAMPVAEALALSRVAVVYGRPLLAVEDHYYVADDGRVMLVVRQLVTPDDAANPEYLEERHAFVTMARPRLNGLVKQPPVLDFSWCNVQDPVDLLRVAPRTGVKNKATAVEVPKAVKDDLMQFRNAAQNQGPKAMVRAKNRAGEEEAYEFDLQGDRALHEDKKADPAEDGLAKMAALLSTKYNADSVRLCNNEIADGNSVVPVLRNLVSNYYMSVSWLDLSSNRIADIPDGLAVLPLTTLYLHRNDISRWDEVKKLCALRKLTGVTLHGNPIATTTPNYKQAVLATLLSAPGKEAALKTLDFVALSRVDIELTTMHGRFNAKKGVLAAATIASAATSLAATSPPAAAKPSPRRKANK
jgi:hypothetical protein